MSYDSKITKYIIFGESCKKISFKKLGQNRDSESEDGRKVTGFYFHSGCGMFWKGLKIPQLKPFYKEGMVYKKVK